jgi:hypothetical protein
MNIARIILAGLAGIVVGCWICAGYLLALVTFAFVEVIDRTSAAMEARR